MPVRSQAQNRFMHAHENDAGPMGKVAREFTAGEMPGSVKALPERVGDARHHALRKASATHLAAAGDITAEHHDRIHRAADAALTALRRKTAMPAAPAPLSFGALAP